MDTQNYAAQSRAATRELTNAFLRSVYNWMSAGLGLTALVALFMANSGITSLFYTTKGGVYLMFGLIALQLGLVFYLSARVQKLSGQAATGIFLAYSALTGITLSSVLLVYTASSVAGAFIATAGMFGATSIYGMVTKRDLAGVGSFCFMGLIGLIIAMIVNMFIGSGPLDLVIGFAGVIIFVGLTAWDTQRLKTMGEMMPHDDATAVRRGTILGALSLYLNFINLFLMILRIFGGRE